VCVWTGEPGLCSWYPGGYVLDGAGFESLGAIDSLVKHPDCLSGPFSLLFIGYQGCFLEIHRPGRGVNHSCLVSELRMSEAVPLLHSCGEGQHSLGAEQGSVSDRIVWMHCCDLGEIFQPVNDCKFLKDFSVVTSKFAVISLCG